MPEREIGSEFWDIPLSKNPNSLFPEKTQWFISGRSALQSVIKSIKGVHSIALPSWCCESIIRPFYDSGINVCFYPVYWENGVFQDIRLDCDALFIMDYFGYTERTIDLKHYRGIVIHDVTHSLFSSYYPDDDYYFGSLRKWCGVFTGGFAWTKSGQKLPTGDLYYREYVSLRKKAMEMKNEYLTGKREDKKYLDFFSKAEECLDDIGVSQSSDTDIIAAKHIDVNYMISKRRENAKALMEVFYNWLLFPELKECDCPMFVPIMVPDGKRDFLRKKLIDNNIYCPVHWPVSNYHVLDQKTSNLYQSELSLVCDQRYSKEDMGRIIESIRRIMGV